MKNNQALVEFLIQKGFVPGQDFSRGPDGFIVLSDEVSKALFDRVPEPQREILMKAVAATQPHRLPTAQEALEKHLGVPFVANLLSIIKKRLPSLTIGQQVCYVFTICVGVEQRTGIELLSRLARVMESAQLSELIHLYICKQNQDEHSDAWVADLVQAAGGGDCLERDLETGTLWVNLRGLELLAQVYQGQASIYETIAALDAHRRGKGNA